MRCKACYVRQLELQIWCDCTAWLLFHTGHDSYRHSLKYTQLVLHLDHFGLRMQFECQCRRRMLRCANKRWALPCRLHLGFSTSSPWPHLRAPRPARRTITVSLADLQSGVLILLLRSRLTASHLKLSTEVTQAESLLRDHIVNLLTIHRVCFVLLAIPNFRNELVLLPGKEARLAAHGPRQQGIGWAGVIRADAASSTQRSFLAQQTSDLSKGHHALLCWCGG